MVPAPKMDMLSRNLDASTYRAARARAALEGRPVGEVVTTALRDYLARTTVTEPAKLLLDQPVAAVAEAHEAAAHVDEVVFLYCI